MQRIDILWRDIPSQVLIKRGRDRGKYMLRHATTCLVTIWPVSR